MSTEFSTETPETATISQAALADTIRRTAEGTNYVLEFPTDHTRGSLFFSLRSTKHYDPMIMGSIGVKGGLRIDRFNHKFDKTKHRGRSAWHWIQAYCTR